jgi:YHS domain-containing protein
LSQGTVVSLAGNLPPEDDALPGDSNRTGFIAAVESQAGAVEPVAYVMAESAAPPGEAVAVDVPPVALGGYCPVELARNGRWVTGDVRFTVVHKGHIYRLSGPTQRKQFLADPDALTPVNSGQDPVLAVDEHRRVPGEAAYCATYNGRLYMFSSAATQAKFNRIPQRYAVR